MGAAASVAGGARIGARALWADVQDAAVVDPGNRASARADRAHVDRREAGHVALVGASDPGLARPRNRVASDKRDVVRRAARVSDDRVLGGALLGPVVVGACDRRQGGARVDRVNGCPGQGVGVDHAALRGQAEHASREAGIL